MSTPKIRFTDADQERPTPAPAPPPVVDSKTLFGGGSELVIRHAGREYRLRRTRLGKLILTA